MTDQLGRDIRHLSLGPKIALNGNGDRPRDSTIASAGDAADIFDLYGSDDANRESWRSSTGQRDSTIGVAYGSPSKHPAQVQRESEVSWSGPMNLLGNHNEEEEEGRARRWSDKPDISITGVTPTSASYMYDQEQEYHENGNGKEYGKKDSMVSSTSSQDPSRLSPRRPTSSSRYTNGTGNGNENGSMSTSTSISEIGNRSNGSGSVSVAGSGSSQYPGEEDDAFMIRNTYARLEKEGVHGDGWDQGIERTRGGPSIGAGKRATVYPATKTGDIGEQERQFLASLDRYGFVNEPLRNRSETRVALIPTAPLSKIPKLPSISPLAGKPPVEPNSTFNPSDGSGLSPRIPPSTPNTEDERVKRREFDRVDKWGKMMSIKKRDQGGNITQWDWSKEGTAKLRKRVYKGIPDRWRMAAWWTLAEGLTREKGKGKGKESEQSESDYRNTLDLPSTFDVQIDLDVPRTISGHTMFVTRYGAGQRNLWHVLHCFSQVCETCGYVQGMGPIAATLLCYFDPARAYTLLVRLHDTYGMHDIFQPGFPGLLEAFYVQERLMEWLMPDLYQSFQRNMISSSAWGTKWYITLFVNTVPFSQQLRLWDALWLDGSDVMIVTSLAILWAFRDLLSSPKATFESILSLLSSYFVAEDEDALMRWIRKVVGQPETKNKMTFWREEWKSLVEHGKSGSALL
ncbi:hypothetical protein I302_107773 [Kwoniella bestiolae CBS 10118]|uniref:GTPase activating protein n=1 Tax=Kwoniella bestiolae CBS 10118 TaxID=1296100 RepID=A0A1B9FXL1_9TREE|nr:GTPase activating protein [Kwoniella bestiolae CBS 10118]OCF23505.1 GTPase activating protein [Kwoniella bestiolae CBS 10118]